MERFSTYPDAYLLTEEPFCYLQFTFYSTMRSEILQSKHLLSSNQKHLEWMLSVITHHTSRTQPKYYPVSILVSSRLKSVCLHCQEEHSRQHKSTNCHFYTYLHLDILKHTGRICLLDWFTYSYATVKVFVFLSRVALFAHTTATFDNRLGLIRSRSTL